MSQDTRESFIELMSQLTPGGETEQVEQPGLIKTSLIIIVLGFLFGLPLMLLWNHFMTGFLPVHDMTYLQAVATFIFMKILV